MIDDRNALLIHSHRSKRGAVNVIGNIAGALFGLLDSEFAKQLSVTIENIKANDESLKHYAENQTMFLDRTLTIMKRNGEEIKREFQALDNLINSNNKNLNKLATELRQEEVLTMFNMLALQAFMQASRFQSVQDSLIDILTDSHHGKISPELLTTNEFQAQLHAINIHSSKNARLPLAIDDIAQYMQIMTVTHQITEKYIIFILKIPLIASKQFEILKLTAIPWAINNTLFKVNLATSYILVDLLRENHVPISKETLQKCKTIDHKVYFCPQSHPTYNTNSSDCNCEMNILRTSRIHSDCHSIQCEETSYWRPLNYPNSWLLAVGSNELIHTVRNNIPSQVEVSGSGILKIGDGCTARTPTVTIEGHEDISTTRQIIYVPECNISKIHITSDVIGKNVSRSSYKINTDIKTLQENLHNLNTVSLNKLRPHDVHHYGLGYTLLVLCICCLTCSAWLWHKQRRTREIRHPTPAPRQLASIPALSPDDAESTILTIFNS